MTIKTRKMGNLMPAKVSAAKVILQKKYYVFGNFTFVLVFFKKYKRIRRILDVCKVTLTPRAGTQYFFYVKTSKSSFSKGCYYVRVLLRVITFGTFIFRPKKICVFKKMSLKITTRRLLDICLPAGYEHCKKVILKVL